MHVFERYVIILRDRSEKLLGWVNVQIAVAVMYYGLNCTNKWCQLPLYDVEKEVQHC